MGIERFDYEAQGMVRSFDGEYVDYKDHIDSHAYDEAKEREKFDSWFENNCNLVGGNARIAAQFSWMACAKSRARSSE